MRISMLAVAAALTGCAVETTAVTPAAPTQRTVTYVVANQLQFEQASRAAHQWCNQTFGQPAQILKRRQSRTSEAVTFGCAGE